MKDALKLYLVTDRALSCGRTLEEVVSGAVSGGATMVQLREKDTPTKEFVELALRIKKLLEPYKVPLIINDRVDVALAADADGVHIGQSDMPYELARKLLGPDKIIGLSVENLDDLIEANDLDVDYVGISPVYGTPTKTDTSEPFGLEGLKEAVRISKHPTVAIGGMNRETAADVMAAGCDGIAAVSAISSAEDIKQATAELKDIVCRNSRGNWSQQICRDSERIHKSTEQKKTGEFGFIDFIRKQFNAPAGVLGIGDDCAVIPSGEGELLYSTDMLMEGVHFLRNSASAEDIGWKSLAVNLSDIAAMGGVPEATFLSLALPKDARGEWAEKFIEGYVTLSKLYNVPLLGGDTTSSLRDVAINVGVLGRAPFGKSIKRNGAVPGHSIYVTGYLGDSAGGLQAILKGFERTPEVKSLIRSHMRPMPRILEGQALMKTGMTGAMMDISDGIASDLRHILEASGVGAKVYLNEIPLSDTLKNVCGRFSLDAKMLAVGGGEDYELLFTAPPEIENKLDFQVFRIGEITPEKGLVWVDNGKILDIEINGFNHF